MRYFIHIVAGRIIEYDDDGGEFSDFAGARAYAIDFLRLAYMLATEPPTQKLIQAFVCIADAEGTILDRVTFQDAFATDNGHPAVSYSAGTA